MNNTVRESHQFVHYFRRYSWHIILPALVCGGSAFAYQHNMPVVFHSSILLEMEYTDQNVRDRVVLTDEAVTLARSDQVKNQLGTEAFDITVHKAGPLLISIVSSDIQPSIAINSEKKVIDYLKDKFPLREIGYAKQYSDKTNPSIFGLGGLLIGALVGLFTSLITEYFRKY
jgi:hypothetical protein